MRRRKIQQVAGLERGERVLASASGPANQIVATDRRLILPQASVPWDQIERASWDGDEETLYVTELTPTGRSVQHTVAITEPGRLVDVVRELVTASVVIIRRVQIDGPQGVRVTGRRQPGGDLTWIAALDPGLDAANPEIRTKIDAAVASVRAEVESAGL